MQGGLWHVGDVGMSFVRGIDGYSVIPPRGSKRFVATSEWQGVRRIAIAVGQIDFYRPIDDPRKICVVSAADGLNAGRSPALRQAIIDRTFHRATCPVCGRTAMIEKPFCYVDFARNTFISVVPTGARHLWKQASAALSEVMVHVPEALSSAKNRQLRVVAGLGELREKLVAQDAGLDDRIAELLKVFAIADHRSWSRRRACG